MTDERIAFYMDEHVSAAVSQGLRNRGVDILTAQEADMREAPDDEQLAFAARQGRIIFTQDADFLRLHAARYPHRGIVYARQRTALGSILRGLMLIYEVLTAEDMADHVEFV